MAEHEDQSPEKSQKPKKNASVVSYIAILFSAAFLLLLMTYLMEHRQSAEALEGLRSSVSAMQSVESLYEENTQLAEENKLLEQDLYQTQQAQARLEEDQEALEEALALAQDSQVALDWFWQLNEAYVLRQTDLAISIIETLEGENLAHLLPLASATDNKRFSPAHRYAEIQRDLLPDLVEEIPEEQEDTEHTEPVAP